MAFPLRSLSWALVTIVSVAALLTSIIRPDVAAPVLGVVLFALYVGLLCEAILDITTRQDLLLRQRLAWLALCILVVPLVPVVAGLYFLMGRRRTALLLAGPPAEASGSDAPRRVAHRFYTVSKKIRRG